MGKKKPGSLTNKDAYQRLNFLYQAACTTLAANPRNVGLARFYTNSMKAVAQKLVLKLDPSIKRTVCKYCNGLLIPGVTSRVRVRAKRETHVVISCLSCGTMKRFLARRNHVLWSEQDSETHQTGQGVSKVQEEQNKMNQAKQGEPKELQN